MTDERIDADSTYAETVTRLARLANRLDADGDGMTEEDFYDIAERLHAAADRAGISHAIAESDYMAEVAAGPVGA